MKDLSIEALFEKKYISLMAEKHIDRWTRVTLTIETDIARIKPTFVIHKKRCEVLRTEDLVFAVDNFNKLKAPDGD
jgi:hypothetical protein